MITQVFTASGPAQQYSTQPTAVSIGDSLKSTTFSLCDRLRWCWDRRSLQRLNVPPQPRAQRTLSTEANDATVVEGLNSSVSSKPLSQDEKKQDNLHGSTRKLKLHFFLQIETKRSIVQWMMVKASKTVKLVSSEKLCPRLESYLRGLIAPIICVHEDCGTIVPFFPSGLELMTVDYLNLSYLVLPV